MTEIYLHFTCAHYLPTDGELKLQLGVGRDPGFGAGEVVEDLRHKA